ncbi:hypothetical protein BBF96_03860 [Anoxybacter fermentans]|uniref:t-SNARE coiled-coil homology domain-containing protein n=1 Tax=Anoxybacter fermentans TaxID=1323375 RepID=A0A3Q9HPI0_9FIRM|nr:hypothetical protein [Anoxybacter fermentans]AZR72597.1 hypothetical protein BBF96_03860 [Anoxybacter fermentans]
MYSKIEKLEANQVTIQADIKELKINQEHIAKKIDAIADQVASLTEFKTETINRLDKIADDLDFIKHKGLQNKKEIFLLKKNFKSSLRPFVSTVSV